MSDIEQAHNAPRLDETKFNELWDILGEDFQSIVDEFINIVPSSLTTITSALNSSDAEKVFIEAHTLKSSSGNLGLSRFSKLCAILESQARSNQILDAEAQVQILNDEFTAGIEELNTRLQG